MSTGGEGRASKRTAVRRIESAMRIAFYAPLKSPAHDVPSGDRRVARLLMDALGRAGHHVDLVSEFRSFEGSGDPARQAELRERGKQIAGHLAARWREAAKAERPDAWFTYHVYHKAPDWLGPEVCASLGIPYAIAEASFAPKRAGGKWAIGHDAARDAIQAAALVLCPTRDDVACIESVVAAPERVVLLPPFIDAAPYRAAVRAREAHRARLSQEHSLDGAVPWIVVAAMMRPGDKLDSYRMLAAALAELADLPWQIVVAGDGPARAEVQAILENAAPRRARFAGELGMDDLAAVYAACDLYVWPAVNEAYGMAMLEAGSAGLAVVSCATRGVPDVVWDGITGLLAPSGDAHALAQLTRALLVDASRRALMGRTAAHFVASERGIDAAALRLDRALVEMIKAARMHRGVAAQ